MLRAFVVGKAFELRSFAIITSISGIFTLVTQEFDNCHYFY